MTRKVLAILLALAMVFALGLSACGEDSSSGGKDKKNDGAASSKEFKEETVHYYLMKNFDQTPDWEADVKPAVTEYVKENLNINVEWHCFGSEYNDRLNSALSAGNDIDIFYVSNSTTPMMTWYQRNALAPLKDLLENYAPGFYKACPDYYWVSTTIDDEIYAMPSVNGTATDIGIFYNETMLDDYGVLDEFVDMEYYNADDVDEFFYKVKDLRTANEPEKDEAALVALPTFNWIYFKADKMSNGVYTMIKDTGSFQDFKDDYVFSLFGTEQYEEYIGMANRWVKDGICPYDADNYDTEKYYNNNGYMLASWSWGNVAAETDKYKDYGWVQNIKHNAHTFTYTLQAHGGLTCVSALTTEDRQIAAMRFWECISEDPQMATTMRCGVEGVHWEKEEKDGMTWANFDIEGGKNSDSVQLGYFMWYFAEMGDLFACYMPSNQPANFFDELTKMNNAAVVSTNMGFLFDNSAVENEVAAVANVINQYDNDLMKGMLDNYADMIDEFNTQLEANGMTTIVEACQEQLNEWRG